MAAVMGLERVRFLLEQAARTGCRVVWVEAGGLMTGPRVGQPRYAVDFTGERLAKIDAGAGRGESGSDARAAADGLDLYEPELTAAPGRRRGSYALVLDGKIVPAISLKSLLLAGLQTIEELRPGSLDKLAGDAGRTKRVVARERELLYGNPNLAKHAEQIAGGWWVATNNNRGEVEKFIRRAAFHAGLEVEIRH